MEEASVHELAPLPVEYPPVGDDVELGIKSRSLDRKSVTFDMDNMKGHVEEDRPVKSPTHLNVRRSVSTESPIASPKRVSSMRRRSKSVLRIRQAPSHMSAKSRSSSTDTKDVQETLLGSGLGTNVGYQGDRRGSFFQSLGQSLLKRDSLGPSSFRTAFISPLVQVMSDLREMKDKCDVMVEDLLNSPELVQCKDQGVTERVTALETYTKEMKDSLNSCIGLLETMDSNKTVGEMAQKQLKTFLKQQSNEPSVPLDQSMNFWISQAFKNVDDAIDQAVLMEPSPSQIVAKSGSFSEEGNKFGIPMPNEYEVSKFFEKIDNWGVDMFYLNEITNNHPLIVTTCAIFRKRDLWKSLKIDQTKLINYINEIETRYHAENPYHNSIHAADVMQSVHTLLNIPTLVGMFMPLEIISLLVAAAVHDVDHPGVTNDFLVQTRHQLAILYHDEAVLECHHLAVAFEVLKRPECDFLCNLPVEQIVAFRKMVIDMVMATDMKEHFILIGTMKTILEDKQESTRELTFDTYNDRIEIMKYLIHSADLSNPTKPIELATKWGMAIREEFHTQGDKMKKLGMDVPETYNRDQSTLAHSQLGFIEVMLNPLVEVLAECLWPSADFIQAQLISNKQHWKAIEDEEKARDKAKGQD